MGSSGAFALYIGRDKILGFSSASLNGMQCTDINLVTIRKMNQLWVRKYIRTDATDGMTRVKTALRVAKAVYDAQKPDLVQVIVLDRNGPTLRSDIRGRAIGADVVYVAQPDRVGGGTTSYTARYYNGGASDDGLFYGDKIDMLPRDAESVVASLTDHSDCADQVAVEAPTEGPSKGKKKKKADAGGDKAEVQGKETAEPQAAPAVHSPSGVPEVPPEGGSTGSFIGASADIPRSRADPQITGASDVRSPVTN